MAPQLGIGPVGSKQDPTEIQFSINSKIYTIGPDIPPTTSLLRYIRDHAKLPGTKANCYEGGCGACIIVASTYDNETDSQKVFSVQACRTLVYSCAGWSIETIERLGNRFQGYHSLQKAMNGFYATQCGYCSPGFLMTMYGQLKSTGRLTVDQVENSLDGNLCRCTGYRPILDAFKSFASDAPQKLKKKLVDIEEAYKSMCPKSGGPCKGLCAGESEETCSSKALQPPKEDLAFTVESIQWFRPTTLSSAYKIIQSLKPEDKFRFVVGNTASGVYKNDGPYNVFIDTSGISELYVVGKGTPLVLGANVNLTRCIQIFREMAEMNTNFKHLDVIADHWDIVANVGVRNVGSWAGNLAIKHQHNEFPSDIFISLAAAEVVLKIGHSNDSSMTEVGIENYLNSDMTQSIILSMSVPPMNENTIIRSYKIGPRAVNAHAYVNASFKFEVDRNDGFRLVSKPTMLFGGINASFLHALKTEAFLNGKRLAVGAAVMATAKRLERDIIPHPSPRDSSPKYRVSLSQSLFYKAVVSILGDRVSPEYQTAGNILYRPISTGHQNFDANKDSWPIGQAVPKLESAVQISGEAEFVDDIALLPNELHGAIIQSTVAKAKIRSVDATEALAIPGVVSYVSAVDIPGYNSFLPKNMTVEPIFADGAVSFAGQTIGLIIAKRRDIALKAVDLVKVDYIDVKKPVLTIKDALLNDPKKDITPKAKTLSWGKEDPDPAAENSIEGVIEMGNQFHFPMEPLATRVVPIEDGYDVFATTQWPTNTQAAVANALNVDANTINISVRRLGGGFGSKISRCDAITCGAAVAARKLQKPIRIATNLTSHMTSVGWRDPYLCDYKASFNDHGTLKTVTVRFLNDTGFTSNDNPSQFTVQAIPNVYNAEAFNLTPHTVNTDTASNTYCRTPGTPNAIAVMENIIEQVAHYLKKDPLEIRERNFYIDGSKTHAKAPKGENIMRTKIFPMIKEQIMYTTRKAQIDVFNKENRWKKRGLAIMPMVYKYHYPPVFRYNTQVSIYNHDGSVAVSHGGIEMGQGINTKVAQVAAKILGVPLSSIQVKPTDTLVGANSSVTGGSYGSDLNAHGVKICCEKIRNRMNPVEQEMEKRNGEKPTWAQLVQQCMKEDLDLSERYWTAQKEHPLPYNIWAAAAVEVEIDVLTGQYLIHRADIIEDAGRSMSPYVDIGQVEGSFVMGVGLYSSELTKYDPETGQKISNGTWEYKVPTAKDIPVDMRVSFLPGGDNQFGVVRSKATGEPAVCLGYGFVMAMRVAIKAARADTGDTEWFDMPTPLTVERIQQLCKVDPSQFHLREKKEEDSLNEFELLEKEEVADGTETSCAVN